jgi:HlyD family secretion protein
MFIPQSNFGKVKTGQKVLLKFQAYPDAEFGSVTGKINFISSIPSDSGYLAKVSLPYGLITNYKKQIQFRDGLIANSEIITENMRLLQRFYYNIFNQMKR